MRAEAKDWMRFPDVGKARIQGDDRDPSLMTGPSLAIVTHACVEGVFALDPGKSAGQALSISKDSRYFGQAALYELTGHGPLFRPALKKAEAVAERIGAERRRAVIGVLDELLFHRPCAHRLVERALQVVDMKVQMHGRPVTIVASHLPGMRRGFGSLALFEQGDLGHAERKHRDTGIRLGRDGEAECVSIKADPASEVGHIDTDLDFKQSFSP
jgi:hypothetical protein